MVSKFFELRLDGDDIAVRTWADDYSISAFVVTPDPDALCGAWAWDVNETDYYGDGVFYGRKPQDIALDESLLLAWLEYRIDCGVSGDGMPVAEMAAELEIDPAELAAFIERASAQ